MNKLNIILVVIFWCISTRTIAQINVGGEPLSWGLGLSINEVNIHETQIIEPEFLAQQDSIDSINNVPPRFGYPIEVNMTLNNSGNWVQLNDGNWIWRLRIHCPEAQSVNILFNEYNLASGSVLHFYSEDKQQLKGGYTARNNKGSLDNLRGFATDIIFNNEVVLELFTSDEMKSQNIIAIDYIVYGYNISMLTSGGQTANYGFGESKKCQTDVRCSPEGDDWQDEKKGVAMIVVDGTRLCTGSLLNNACEDGKLYFLTASHCVDGGIEVDRNLDAWSFWWNYEASECGNEDEPNWHVITTGAELKMQIPQNKNDVAMLELLESPIEATGDMYFAYFNGWSRTTAPTQGGVGIHHPKGDVKKIALHDYTPFASQTSHSLDNWSIYFIDNGNERYGIEEGSSGSPLFMKTNSLVIGPLASKGRDFWCNEILNDNGQQAFYGMISLAWNTYTPQDEQLEFWLGNADCGSPMELQGGYYYQCPYNLTVNYPIWNSQLLKAENDIIANNQIGSGAAVTMEAGNSIVMTAGFKVNDAKFKAYIAPCESEIVNKRSDEPFFETYGNNPFSDFELFPNPAADLVTIKNASESNTIVTIFNVTGALVYELPLASKSSLELPLNNLRDGVYLIRFYNGYQMVTKRLIIEK